MFGAEAAAEMTTLVRGFVERELTPLREEVGRLKGEIDRLRDRPHVTKAVVDRAGVLILTLSNGDTETIGQVVGKDGDSLTVEDVRPLLTELVAAAVKALPAPEKGEPGEVDMEAVATIVTEQVKAEVAKLPAPKDGESVTIDQVQPLLAGLVDAAVKALPAPKDGVGLAGATIDRNGALIVTLSNGEPVDLGPIVGKDGETFTLDDFDIEQIDERTFKFKFTRGDACHSFEFAFPIVLDRGVWVDEKLYERGDAVSWAGSLWIAQRDAPGKPDTADGGWRLAVKRGRDGKNLRATGAS
jgi:hypothetical protein